MIEGAVVAGTLLALIVVLPATVLWHIAKRLWRAR